MPTGYPSTVKPNYERYIAMQAFQNVVASTNAIVSSTFLLYAVGLDAGAIPVAGTPPCACSHALGPGTQALASLAGVQREHLHCHWCALPHWAWE